MGKSTTGFHPTYFLVKPEHKKQWEHRTAPPWGKCAQLMPQMAMRSTSVNLYSSLTTGSIFVFIQLLRHLTLGLSTSTYKRLKAKFRSIICIN